VYNAEEEEEEEEPAVQLLPAETRKQVRSMGEAVQFESFFCYLRVDVISKLCRSIDGKIWKDSPFRLHK
jgi:hypothetical protein